MKQDVWVQEGVIIPENELEITTSRSGGAGGQHVNKTDSRITVRWNVKTTVALSDAQKARVCDKLQARLTSDGDLMVHHSASRSQLQNKEAALQQLAYEVRKALHVPKKRTATKVPKAVKAARLNAKAHRGGIKKMRSKKISDE